MNRHQIRGVIAVLLCLPLWVRADALNFSGFGTLGALWLNRPALGLAYPVRTDEVHAGRIHWAANSMLGVQLSGSLTDQAEVTLQSIVRKHDRRLLHAQISWAFLRYQTRLPALSLRFGRMGLPVFMLSDSRNIRYLRPWVKPPLEVYLLNPFQNLDGMDALYRRRIWHGIDLEIHPYLGSSRDSSIGGSRLLAIRGLSIGFEHENNEFYIGFARSRYRCEDICLKGFRPRSTQRTAFENANGKAQFFAVGGAYSIGNWSFSGEYAKRQLSSWIPSMRGGYVRIDYRHRNWTPYILYAQSELTSELPSNILMSYYEGDDFIMHDNAQRSYALGVRWDFATDMALKIQWSKVEPDGGWGAFVPLHGTEQRMADDVNMLDVTLDFIF